VPSLIELEPLLHIFAAGTFGVTCGHVCGPLL